jgi:hypothetical protein
VPTRKAIAKGHPNRPADTNVSPGDVSGEATMNATIGAHGAVVAIIDSTTAVVPQEQKGVSTAAPTAAAEAVVVRRFSQRLITEGPT